jgi:hypothetical protein
MARLRKPHVHRTKQHRAAEAYNPRPQQTSLGSAMFNAALLTASSENLHCRPATTMEPTQHSTGAEHIIMHTPAMMVDDQQPCIVPRHALELSCAHTKRHTQPFKHAHKCSRPWRKLYDRNAACEPCAYKGYNMPKQQHNTRSSGIDISQRAPYLSRV